jgi:integrase
MARKPSVRFFASRNAYYCQYNGRQHRLASGPDDSPSGPNYLAALDAYKHLMRMGAVGTSKDRNTVRVVLETYLQHAKGRIKDSTFTSRLHSYRPLCAALGETAIGDLTPFDIERFIVSMRQPRKVGNHTYAWGDPAVSNFVDHCRAAFRWALKKRLITTNPMDRIDRPASRSRSRDCLISPDQHRMILAESRAESFRRLCVALENTGARSGELVGATAADWDDGLGAIVYYGDDRRREDEFRHKSAGKNKDRVIYFTGEALEMMRGLVRKHPEGPLFRSKRGGGYSRRSVTSCFEALRRRLGMPKLTSHSYRHTLATNWPKAGKSIDILAEILGNTPVTIRKHYAHLCADRQGIRRHLEEFRREAGTGTPTPAPLPAEI